MKLETELLHPRVLRADYFSAYTQNTWEHQLVPRRCYDYELEYYTRSDGGILVEGEYIEFKAREVNFRKPGQVVCGVFPYSCHLLCFSVDSSYKTTEGYGFGCPEEAEPAYKNPLLDSLPSKIVPENPELLLGLFQKIYQLASRPDDLSRFEANRQLSELLFLLFSQQWSLEASGYNRKILPAVEYIKENFCEDISVQALIDRSGLSKTYFHKCFKAYMKTTPAGLVTGLRMDKAKTLLHLTGSSVADIAAACGYLDNVYFSHLFKKNTGMTPTSYRTSTRFLQKTEKLPR